MKTRYSFLSSAKFYKLKKKWRCCGAGGESVYICAVKKRKRSYIVDVRVISPGVFGKTIC